ncbi:immune inhibitor A [Dehalococcoidia bacterium]|nr:immune inhibitor A [Dehalococcoidia bacterium]
MNSTSLQTNLTDHQIGHVDTFHVLNISQLQQTLVTGILRYVSTHAYFYVKQGVNISQADLAKAASDFEDNIIPAIHKYINPTWNPGAGIDSRISILNAPIPGVGGYVNSLDLFPKSIHINSNERPMVYMSLISVHPGTRSYASVLAHEMQHAAHSQADPFEVGWVQEGASELLAELAGYPVYLYRAFIDEPDTQLTTWGNNDLSPAHYGAAHLFLRYVGAKYGFDQFHKFTTQQESGIYGIAAFLREINADADTDVNQLLHDWALANSSPASTKRMPGYAVTDFRAALSGSVKQAASFSGVVNQYASDYIRIEDQDRAVEVRFQGSTTAPVLPTGPRSGSYAWWSNRGDKIDSTLTREFNLSEVAEATLSFDIWHDIEAHFDYGYVEASTDGGATWEILAGAHTSAENRLGHSFGHSYTGQSEWKTETIDLSPYAGRRILLRFEYLTDESTNHAGFLIDNIAIPEIGFLDNVESDLGWRADGFLRTDNQTDQLYFVNLITLSEDKPITVTKMELEDTNEGSVTLVAGQPGVLVITAVADVTAEPAHYTISVSPSPVEN